MGRLWVQFFVCTQFEFAGLGARYPMLVGALRCTTREAPAGGLAEVVHMQVVIGHYPGGEVFECSVSFPAPAANEPISPQRIVSASEEIVGCIAAIESLALAVETSTFEFLSCPLDLRKLDQRISQATSEVSSLSDTFAAGYADLCRARQEFGNPRFPDALWSGSAALSHHLSAAAWGSCAFSLFTDVLGSKKANGEELASMCIGRAHDLRQLVQERFCLPDDAKAVLRAERLQAELICERLFAKGINDPDDAKPDRSNKPRYTPPSCRKCGSETAVKSSKKTHRYIRCPACGDEWKVAKPKQIQQ